MDQKDAITALVSHLQADLAVPIKVSGMDDERPVPAVVIEDWSKADVTHHNTALAGQVTDPADNTEYLWYRFYWTMRVELVVRHADEVAAHGLLGDLQRSLAMVSEDPLAFHDHLNDLRLRGAGGISHTFLESKETQLNQTVRLTAFHQVKDDTFDTIQTIENQITLKS